MRIRSLGLALLGSAALSICVAAGPAQAQDSAVAAQQRYIAGINAGIDGNVTRAIRAYQAGDCDGYFSARNDLAIRVLILETGGPRRQPGPRFRVPESTLNELEARTRLALASLPAACDPDPFIRQSLANEGDPADIAGGGGDD